MAYGGGGHDALWTVVVPPTCGERRSMIHDAAGIGRASIRGA
jgi:hypothetical protein